MNLHICEFAYLSYVQKYDTIIDSDLNIIVCKVAVTLLNRVCGLNMKSRWDRCSLHTEIFTLKTWIVGHINLIQLKLSLMM